MGDSTKRIQWVREQHRKQARELLRGMQEVHRYEALQQMMLDLAGMFYDMGMEDVDA